MQPMQGYEEACKEQHWCDVDAGFTGVRFTGLLLDGSLSQNPRPAAMDGAEADVGLQETEEEKNYWNNILNLVNSSSALLSTSVVVTTPEAYSSAPEF